MANFLFRNIKTKLRKKYFGLTGLSNLENEITPYKRFLKGVVLNAGAGQRPVQIKDPYLTTDFDETAPVDFLCDLHYIPLINHSVDSILSVAVLEHTRFPWMVVKEFNRVLKPGGFLVLCVPFLQPEHAIPHDFYRFTLYGVQALLDSVGLKVIRQTRLSRYYRALGWILNERWKESKGVVFYFKSFIVNQISRRSRDEEQDPRSVYTGSYTTAKKGGEWKLSNDYKIGEKFWYKDLLTDPITKTPLVWIDEGTVRNEKGDLYQQINGKFDFRPKGELSQDHLVKWG